ncbi:hypothetical protein DMUE_0387 [Dictyocoela muelleri]|nr:hypothetical protein DMUE_0387 [Dictyocoela muelleri]
MWTVPLRDKSVILVVTAIKSIFMVNGPGFILHTDNGREFCNGLMREMLEDFNVRHVKIRARCPWIQGQVIIANQTIKWMIGSMLMTLNTPGKWTLVRENATYSYNTMPLPHLVKLPLFCFLDCLLNKLYKKSWLQH